MTPDRNAARRVEEVDYVTRNFRNLQGLRVLPLVPVLVVCGPAPSPGC